MASIRKKIIEDTRFVVDAFSLSVGLNKYYCKSWVVSRVINLDVDCQDVNYLKNMLLVDIENAKVLYLWKLVVFLDQVALIAYWPAFTSLKDEMGHSAYVFVLSACSPGINVRRLPLLSIQASSIQEEFLWWDSIQGCIFYPILVFSMNHSVNTWGLKSIVGKGCSLFYRETVTKIISSQSTDASENSCWELGNISHFHSFLNVVTTSNQLLTELINWMPWSGVLKIFFLMFQSDASRRRVDMAICVIT